MCIYKSFAKTMQRYKLFTRRQWHKPKKNVSRKSITLISACFAWACRFDHQQTIHNEIVAADIRLQYNGVKCDNNILQKVF